MSVLYKILIFILKCLFLKEILCSPIENEMNSFYDQKQTGKYNIHISLRDVTIIEVDKNQFSDDAINNSDEYYYDEEDLTINPASNWISSTIKPSEVFFNTTQKIAVDKKQPNITLIESSLYSNRNSLLIQPSETTTLKLNMEASVAKKPVSHLPSQSHLVYVPVKLKNNNTENNKMHSLSEALKKVSNILSIRNEIPELPMACRNYQVRDANGNCRYWNRQKFLKSLLDLFSLMRLKS